MNDRIDNDEAASSKGTHRSDRIATTGAGWSLSPLAKAFWAIVAANILLIYLVFEVESSSSSAGGDAAGNAMSNGFRALIEYTALAIVGGSAALFMLVRRRWFRLNRPGFAGGVGL